MDAEHSKLPFRPPVTDFLSTSPSIYAAFSNIGAYDSCGAEVISTTLLSFAPGELPTVVGPRYFGNIAATTWPFDFADLVGEEPNLLMNYHKWEVSIA